MRAPDSRRRKISLDIKQLKAIVTVAEVGSVTRAADLLHLVQPAVTRQIRTLEQELGIPLFERTGQGMRPTEAGTIMVDRARRALNELERARAEVQPTPGVVTGIVTLGLLESTSDLLAEPLVTALARDHPGVELRLMTAYSGHLQTARPPSTPTRWCASVCGRSLPHRPASAPTIPFRSRRRPGTRSSCPPQGMHCAG